MRAFIKTLLAEIKKQHKNYFHSKIIYISLFLWPLLSFITTYYSFQTFDLMKSNVIYITQGNVIIYLLIGYMVMSFFRSLVQSAWNFSFERVSGTLELIYLSPTNRAAVLLGNAVASLFESIIVMLVFSVFMLILKKEEINANVIPCVVLFLIIMVMASLWGMFLNSIFLFSRDSGFLFTILEEPMEIFSGVKVPTELFPVWAKVLSVIFPLTYAIEGTRRVLLLGSSLYDIRNLIFISLIIISILISSIMIIINKVEKHTRMTGNLTLF
ncbi:ABC-2 type transport system permease protein [Mobilisporobacter senegalensis]|uniref:Transport permease protein n=1 Tax=Mobilisporobacter senegalensis TaxID=1329262 RepID=A0A3N1XKD1_9FIRM|nr:ABC transporter permease [Mobilisporobacter senegalensis]ROR27153.1 ABC-2 type transport system permease protein [Mobilisporobacter senegalensis]